MKANSFGPTTTAEQAISDVDLLGVRAIITGGSSGIGAETARVLASAGAQVTVAVRSLAALRNVAKAIGARYGENTVRVAALDLANLESVRSFTSAWSGPLHILINNAGIMSLPERTVNGAGHELQFATNHLGHFALTLGLRRALATGAQDTVVANGALGGARVVSLSSRGHLRAPVAFDDIDFDNRAYEPLVAYGQSKTANVLFAVELARRWAADGVSANAVHPGAVMGTGLSRHMPASVLDTVVSASDQVFKSVEQGAATSIVVATSPALARTSGKYFEDCREAEVIQPTAADLASQARGVAWYAVDHAKSAQLWQLSEQLVA
jgi:NAD(P)-dependent dehydrogenase (short-subunit alcohol dehydrogenase family)